MFVKEYKKKIKLIIINDFCSQSIKIQFDNKLKKKKQQHQVHALLFGLVLYYGLPNGDSHSRSPTSGDHHGVSYANGVSSSTDGQKILKPK